jgi:hypothetical protein
MTLNPSRVQLCLDLPCEFLPETKSKHAGVYTFFSNDLKLQGKSLFVEGYYKYLFQLVPQTGLDKYRKIWYQLGLIQT